MVTITAHCIIKNEENFIAYAIKSVIDSVDKLIIYDTGSKDKTVEIVKALVVEYPDKIIFEEKGECDKKRHTALRQEMLERTTTDWFMVLDGDEVWTRRALTEACEYIDTHPNAECLIAPFYLCVGDIYHHSRKGHYAIQGKNIHATPRFFKCNGVQWVGDYGSDSIVDTHGNKVFEKTTAAFIQNKFWHVSHLTRSSIEGVYSSGTIRALKKMPTYLGIGNTITEPIPEVFSEHPSTNSQKLPLLGAFLNLFSLGAKKLFRSHQTEAKPEVIEKKGEAQLTLGKKILFYCILYAIVAIFLFTVFEGVLRIVNPYYVRVNMVPCAVPSTFPGIATVLKANCTEYGLNSYDLGVEYHVNSCGFRGAEDECSNLKKLSTQFGSKPAPFIAAIGDSYTMAKGVSADDSYVKVMEKDLATKGFSMPVYNFALGGYNLHHKFLNTEMLVQEGYRPQLIVLQYLYNDMWEGDVPFPHKAYKMWLKRHFYTYRFLSTIKNLIVGSNAEYVSYPDMRSYAKQQFTNKDNMARLKKELCDFHDYLKKNSIKGVFWLPPNHAMLTDWSEYDNDFRKIDATIMSYAQECGWDKVVSTIEPESHYAIKDLVLDLNQDHHPNKASYKIVGDTLSDAAIPLLSSTAKK